MSTKKEAPPKPLKDEATPKAKAKPAPKAKAKSAPKAKAAEAKEPKAKAKEPKAKAKETRFKAKAKEAETEVAEDEETDEEGEDAKAPRSKKPSGALVIVESPAKAKTIKKYLGSGYVVKASVGHVKDLPKKTMGIDIENDFAPRYEVIDGKKKVLAEIMAAARKAERVFLAPDPDREGEAIA